MSTRFETGRRTTAVALTALLALSGGALSACAVHDASASAAVSSHGASHDASQQDSQSSQIALYTTMRTLWAQHMEWTWATVVAFAEGSSALQASIDRLLANQEDIGKAVASFYGDDAGEQLTALLKTHITDALPVLTAAKAGDTAALKKAVHAWYANAKDIADFLAAANPNWPRSDLRMMMRMHITQTIAYASDMLAGDYRRAIVGYDTAEAHMAQMADTLSAGIIAQFPDVA